MARVYDNIYQGSVSKQWLEVYEYATMPNIYTVNFHVCLALYIVAVYRHSCKLVIEWSNLHFPQVNTKLFTTIACMIVSCRLSECSIYYNNNGYEEINSTIHLPQSNYQNAIQFTIICTMKHQLPQCVVYSLK